MVHDARRAKVVVLASDGDDEDVVVKGPLRRDLAALGVEIRRHLHLTAIPIDPDHLSDPVAKAVPVGLRKVIDLVGARYPCSRRRFREASASTHACGFARSA